MGSDWLEVTLDESSLIVDSLHKSPKYADEGYPMVRVTDIKPGFLDLSKTNKVTETVYEKFSKKYKPKKGDIIFSRVGSYGESCYVATDDKFCLGQNTIVINPKIDNRYLYYVLQSHLVKHQIENTVVGTTQKTISLKSIKALKFRCPPTSSEQKRIAHILGSLDDKIELNRQMNQTLEAMAQALFKSWFVDFDPVIDNALEAGNPIPEPLQNRAQIRQALRNSGQAKPLPQHIQKLFPNSFTLTDALGWVPEGWEVGQCQDIIDVRDGTHDSPQKAPEGYPLVTSRHITSGKLDLTSTYLISKSDFEKVNERSKVMHGDILLTMIGTVGIPYYVSQRSVNFAIKNIGLFRTSETELFRYYFFYLLKSPAMQNYLDERIAGTTQKYLSLKVLRSIATIIPKNNLLAAFNKITTGLIDRIAHIDAENIKFSKLRDTLLPKLISGELRIPEAEEQAKEATA